MNVYLKITESPEGYQLTEGKKMKREFRFIGTNEKDSNSSGFNLIP